MYTRLKFHDPYGKTSLSSRKALLLCAYCHFTIPHNVVGAIIFGDALAGVRETYFDRDVRSTMTLGLRSFVETDWYLPAIKSMGYPDIVRQFNRIDKKVQKFIARRFATEPYDIDVVYEKVESLIPRKYMAIIRKSQPAGRVSRAEDCQTAGKWVY